MASHFFVINDWNNSIIEIIYKVPGFFRSRVRTCGVVFAIIRVDLN